ncbi:MAG: YceD family protein [Parvibaculales bacterium]
MTKPEFSREVELKKIPQNGMRFDETAIQEELTALAARYRLEAVLRFHVEAELSSWRKKGIQAQGKVSATLRQTCVVTLEVFDQQLEENFNTLFLPARMIHDSDDPDADVPEAMTDGIADIGELAVQVLALGIDPHPRKPDAEFQFQGKAADAPVEEKDNPFQALKDLYDS